jgi:RNA polymerase sigma-32 factor
MDSRLSNEQVKRIADKLEVPESDVERMSERMHARDMSLNVGKYDDGDGEMLDFIEDDAKPIGQELEDMETRTRGRELLKKHLACLPERDRGILVARRLSDPVRTLEELSAEYGISRERVRQIEDRAFEKLRIAVLEDAKGWEQAA